MSNHLGLRSASATLGISIVTLGCTPNEPGSLDDEVGTSEDTGTGETGDGDTGTDTGPNDIPFELVFGGLNATGKFVALRFSEPVGPVDGIDPSDFRISYAKVNSFCDYYGYCKDQTNYWDPNFYATSYSLFEVDMVTSGMQDTDVFLRFATPLDPAVCKYASYAGLDEALFVHYSPGGIPLESADGETLAPIGLQWAEIAEPSMIVDGSFPDLDPKISIKCNL